MQNQNDCLHAAMFVASESYSGSTYEMGLFESMDEMCGEALVLAHEDRVSNVSALAT